jgi:hypothetical protein
MINKVTINSVKYKKVKSKKREFAFHFLLFMVFEYHAASAVADVRE